MKCNKLLQNVAGYRRLIHEMSQNAAAETTDCIEMIHKPTFRDILLQSTSDIYISVHCGNSYTCINGPDRGHPNIVMCRIILYGENVISLLAFLLYIIF